MTDRQLSSLNNFLWDIFIRSFECRDALYEDIAILSVEEKAKLISSYFRDIEIWGKIYDEHVSLIKQNVKIFDKDDYEEIDDVFFHPQFGWTITSKDKRAYLGKSSLSCGVQVEIGNHTYFSGHSSLRGQAKFRVGKYCAIAEGLYANVVADYHPMDFAACVNFKSERRLKEEGLSFPLTLNNIYENAKVGIEIGHDVWIARNVRLYHGTKIGNGCTIAENSLVRKDCEPYGIYAGIPAKLIRYRFSKSIVERLLEIEWWNWPFSKIKRNTRFFDTDLTKFDGELSDIIIDD